MGKLNIGKPVSILPEAGFGRRPMSTVQMVATALASCTNGQWLPVRAKNITALRATLGGASHRNNRSALYGCEVRQRGTTVYIRRAQ